MSAVLSGARAPTILVVDDSWAVRQLTVSVLRRQGYDVLEAGDGREGLDTALREQPDVILCDIHMPILDGWDVVREARSSESLGTTPILMLTSDNDRVSVLGLEFQVFAVPGHTLGHIAFYHEGVLFCGDTLFAAGCGRLFEGTPEQMHTSLSRLAALPEQTRVYCTHEYTLSNLRFAVAVEPGNRHTAERLADVIEKRQAGTITLPSTLALEKQTNPFLRVGETSVKDKVDERNGPQDRAPSAVFAALRAWKDTF